MRTLLIFCAVFIVALFGMFSVVQGGWERQGSPGVGTIYTLAFVGSDLYAGADYPNGILVSHDDGVNWESLGLKGFKVLAIAASGPNLLAGLDYSEGAYLSTDGGMSWSRKVIENASIFSFLVSGSTVLAGADSGHVYRSTDNGINWTEGSVGGNCLVHTFAIQGTSIFAGTLPRPYMIEPGLGVRLSTDDGVTWTPTAMNGLWCYDEWGLCVSGNNLIAAACTGIFVSTNGGSSWSEALNDWAQGGGFKCGFALGGGKVFATACGGGRIPMSANDGRNWTDVNQREMAVDVGQHALAINNEYLYVASAIDDQAIWRCPLSELYVCGDADGNGMRNISDCVFVIAYVFTSGPAPTPEQLGDANNDGLVNISDVVYMIRYIFANGPAPCNVYY
jgi:photosystem II stability/assembly factor-like uncharacterized protein